MCHVQTLTAVKNSHKASLSITVISEVSKGQLVLLYYVMHINTHTQHVIQYTRPTLCSILETNICGSVFPL